MTDHYFKYFLKTWKGPDTTALTGLSGAVNPYEIEQGNVPFEVEIMEFSNIPIRQRPIEENFKNEINLIKIKIHGIQSFKPAQNIKLSAFLKIRKSFWEKDCYVDDADLRSKMYYAHDCCNNDEICFGDHCATQAAGENNWRYPCKTENKVKTSATMPQPATCYKGKRARSRSCCVGGDVSSVA